VIGLERLKPPTATNTMLHYVKILMHSQ